MSYKIVVYVPVENTDSIRDAIADVGGGRLGKYTHCTFSVRGVGRFRPGEGANPHIGKVGIIKSVEEERVEVTCDGAVVKQVIKAIKRVHPYEEVALDVYKLEDIN